jgi:hypothetical protein
MFRQMPEPLVLRPDPVKERLSGTVLPAVIGIAIATVVTVLLHEFGLGLYAYFAVVILLGAFLLWLMMSEQPDERIELHCDGLALITARGRHFHKWRDLSRFTLLEETSRDANGNMIAGSHYLAVRFLKPGKTETTPESVTSEHEADLLIPIDVYISQNRYSGRSGPQEAACKSPEDFADTVNRWRDHALNLEISSVLTPVVQTENNALAEISLMLYEKPRG